MDIYEKGWLSDPITGNRFAPKTLSDQILNGDGSRFLEQYNQDKMDIYNTINSLDLFSLNWYKVEEITLSGVTYTVMWAVDPSTATESDNKSGIGINSTGKLYRITYNGSSYSIAGYDNNNWYTGNCSSGSSTAAKSASCNNYEVVSNTLIHMVFANPNTAKNNVTLKINSKTALPLYLNGQPISSTNYEIPKGWSGLLYCDGTKYYMRTDGKLPIPQIEQLETKVNQMDACVQLAIVEKGQAYEWKNVTLADSLTNYREILFAFANSAGAIFKVTTLPVSFFRNYISGTIFVNICHTENDGSMSRASIYYVNNTTISTYTPRMNDVLNRLVVVGIK